MASLKPALQHRTDRFLFDSNHRINHALLSGGVVVAPVTATLELVVVDILCQIIENNDLLSLYLRKK